MAHLIEVAFTGNRKGFYQWAGDEPPPLKAGVIVDADRGEDLGHVHATGELAEVRCRGCAHGCGTSTPTEKALRLATAEDEARWRQLRADAETARKFALQKVRQHQLVMKVSDAEWQFDGKKLTLYFTSEKRVDFRGLVRDLAAHFRARIELKQIGVRDEAKRLSGIGRCGREYCSASWLPDLRPVNLSVAKDQRLSLNPTQISGACGRLMCCLRYEHEFYVQQRKRFPKEGKILITRSGEAKVVANDIFNERVTLRSADGETRVVPLADLRRELDSLIDGSVGFGTPAGGLAIVEAIDEPADGLDALDAPLADPEATAAPRTALRATVATMVAVPAGDAASPPVPEDEEDDDGSGDDDEPVTDADRTAAAATDGTPRPRRRRGRRGGRRGRGDRGPGTPPPSSTPPT
jgi:cell fate regulator YaaT (PSP1 superfamily)